MHPHAVSAVGTQNSEPHFSTNGGSCALYRFKLGFFGLGPSFCIGVEISATICLNL